MLSHRPGMTARAVRMYHEMVHHSTRILLGKYASEFRNVMRCVTARRANHLVSAKTCPAPHAKINRFAMTPNQTYNYRRPVPT
jgi:hypothetical protein